MELYNLFNETRIQETDINTPQLILLHIKLHFPEGKEVGKGLQKPRGGSQAGLYVMWYSKATYFHMLKEAKSTVLNSQSTVVCQIEVMSRVLCNHW